MSRAAGAAEKIASSQMNCAQAVLTAFCEELGMEKQAALKLALPFGAGMGRTDGVCGAVTGAYMVLGLRPHEGLSPIEKKEKVYALVGEFNRRFKALHGSVGCTVLLGSNLGTPEGMASAKDRKLINNVCPGLVSDAVSILEDLQGGI
jgi:C_GCAxxG_C_C family probable redox protein